MLAYNRRMCLQNLCFLKLAVFLVNKYKNVQKYLKKPDSTYTLNWDYELYYFLVIFCVLNRTICTFQIICTLCTHPLSINLLYTDLCSYFPRKLCVLVYQYPFFLLLSLTINHILFGMNVTVFFPLFTFELLCLCACF